MTMREMITVNRDVGAILIPAGTPMTRNAMEPSHASMQAQEVVRRDDQ